MEESTISYTEYAALLNQCDKELDELYHSYAVQHGISDAALWILYAVYSARSAITQADICSYWFFSRQTINTALKGLEQQGLLELIPLSGNRKCKQVRFTAKGRCEAQQILTPLLRAESLVFASLTDEENRVFAELSQKRCSLLREFIKTESRLSSEEWASQCHGLSQDLLE